MNLLLHICCAPCAVYSVKTLRMKGFDVTGYFYKNNIHPYTEHQRRLEAMQSLAKKLDFPLITAEGYDIVEYFNRVTGHESQRCRYCFQLRLQKTAETAIELGFGGFTSSLLISPHQKHELLLEIGNSLSEEMKIRFLYADLRKHYLDSRHITKPLALYRQQYCGCVYSEWERYAGINIE